LSTEIICPITQLSTRIYSVTPPQAEVHVATVLPAWIFDKFMKEINIEWNLDLNWFFLHSCCCCATTCARLNFLSHTRMHLCILYTTHPVVECHMHATLQWQCTYLMYKNTQFHSIVHVLHVWEVMRRRSCDGMLMAVYGWMSGWSLEDGWTDLSEINVYKYECSLNVALFLHCFECFDMNSMNYSFQHQTVSSVHLSFKLDHCLSECVHEFDESIVKCACSIIHSVRLWCFLICTLWMMRIELRSECWWIIYIESSFKSLLHACDCCVFS
jgi:hypothetical protein